MTTETVETPEELRARLRAFLSDYDFTPSVDTWLSGWDEDFSKALAEQGWLGMTIPEEYGGHGRSFTDRFIVTEELLAAGAPIAAHWIADRQIAPSLLTFGTEEQKRSYLPRIAAGTCYFGIGMSEPDSGSDLASVRSKAVQVDGGYRLTGTKVWTSGAHHAEAFIALARTSPLDTSARHAGLSQFIVDLRSPGVTINPIVSMLGRHHFNEVVFDNVFIPDSRVFGTIGNGWAQVNSELAYERSGPERVLSSFRLLAELAGSEDDSVPEVGRLLARTAGLRGMSAGIAEDLQSGRNADLAASMVKIMGTGLEGDVVEIADIELGSGGGELAALGLAQRPGFTLRGGTSEILRGIVARGMGLR